MVRANSKVIQGKFGPKRIISPERTFSYFGERGISKSTVDKSDIEHTENGFRINYRLPNGERAGYWLDRDLRPGADNRFLAPKGKAPRLFFPELLGKVSWQKICLDPVKHNLIITEGPVKGMALASRDIPAVCPNGVHGWHKKASTKLLADFDLINFDGRTVIFLFDHDVQSNWVSQLGLKQLGKRIQERNGVIYIALMPDLGDGKSGVDDLLSARGIKGLRKILKAKKPIDHEDFRKWGLPNDPHPTDSGRAQLFAGLFREELRYNKARDTWFTRERHIWVADDCDRVFGHVRTLSEMMLADAADELDKDRRKQKYSNALALENVRPKELMLREAGTLDEFRLPTEAIDAAPLLFGVHNGIIDVAKGVLLEHQPSDVYITKMGRVFYDPDADCPLWLRFLDEIFESNESLIAYIQRSVGYFMTGDTSDQSIFIFHGHGANGKSTFTGILKELLGAYCRTVAVESLMAKRYDNASGPKEDLARLAGARLVLASETEESKPLAESLIKQMTGGETLTARELYRSSFEFKPQFKIVLVANHIPIIKGNDHAIWRRIRLVPFNVTIPRSKQDERLPQKLLKELSGILNWALVGANQWQRRGLKIPKAVAAATADYRSDMDIVGRFLGECAELGNEHQTATKMELYKAFEEWCRDEGIRQPMQHAVLGKKLAERGIREAKSGNRRYYRGVRLNSNGGELRQRYLNRKEP